MPASGTRRPLPPALKFLYRPGGCSRQTPPRLWLPLIKGPWSLALLGVTVPTPCPRQPVGPGPALLLARPGGERTGPGPSRVWWVLWLRSFGTRQQVTVQARL